MDSKPCSRCGVVKPLEMFSRHRRPGNGYRDGRAYTCKACANESTRAWVAKNRDKANACSKAWRERNPEYMAMLNRTQRLPLEERKRERERFRLEAEVRLETARPLAILNQFDYGPPLSNPPPGTVRRYNLLKG